MNERIIGYVATGEVRPPMAGEPFMSQDSTGVLICHAGPHWKDDRRIARPLTADDVIVPRSEIDALRAGIEDLEDVGLVPDSGCAAKMTGAEAILARLPKREPTIAEHLAVLRRHSHTAHTVEEILAMHAAIAALESQQAQLEAAK